MQSFQYVNYNLFGRNRTWKVSLGYVISTLCVRNDWYFQGYGLVYANEQMCQSVILCCGYMWAAVAYQKIPNETMNEFLPWSSHFQLNSIRVDTQLPQYHSSITGNYTKPNSDEIVRRKVFMVDLSEIETEIEYMPNWHEWNAYVCAITTFDCTSNI